MKLFIYIIITLHTNYIFGTTYSLPKNNSKLIGTNLEYCIPKNNIHSLEYFAAKFHVGLRNMLQANPNIDLYLPSYNQLLIIPKKLILPNTLQSGIIINNAEMRLYYYPKNSNTVIVFPISIGTPEHATPSNWITSIKHKKKNPIWIPTKNMHNEFIKQGEILPMYLPAGANNPMGKYALYLGKYYAIHGANSNLGIGLRITRGCIRLRPKDIEYLYTIVPVGTMVQFINEPIKTTTDSNGKQYLEIHTPLFTNTQDYHIIENNLKIRTYLILKNIPNIDYKIVQKTLAEKTGIPVNITLTKK